MPARIVPVVVGVGASNATAATAIRTPAPGRRARVARLQAKKNGTPLAKKEEDDPVGEDVDAVVVAVALVAVVVAVAAVAARNKVLKSRVPIARAETVAGAVAETAAAIAAEDAIATPSVAKVGLDARPSRRNR